MKILLSIAAPKDIILIDIGKLQGCKIINQREPSSQSIWKQDGPFIEIPTKMHFKILGLANELSEYDSLIAEESWKSPKEQTLIIELQYDTSGSSFSR